MITASARRFWIVILVVFCVTYIASAFWEVTWVSHERRLKDLYRSAVGGDVGALRILSQLPRGSFYLQQIVTDQNAYAEVRAEGVRLYGSQRWPNLNTIAGLLSIDQPFVIRRAAADVFRKRGCSDDCISASLYALAGIWDGRPTAEVRFTQHLGPDMDTQAIQSRLRGESENDYLSLLNSNPCVARKALRETYTSDPATVGRFEKVLKPC